MPILGAISKILRRPYGYLAGTVRFCHAVRSPYGASELITRSYNFPGPVRYFTEHNVPHGHRTGTARAPYGTLTVSAIYLRHPYDFEVQIRGLILLRYPYGYLAVPVRVPYGTRTVCDKHIIIVRPPHGVRTAPLRCPCGARTVSFRFYFQG